MINLRKIFSFLILLMLLGFSLRANSPTNPVSTPISNLANHIVNIPTTVVYSTFESLELTTKTPNDTENIEDPEAQIQPASDKI